MRDDVECLVQRMLAFAVGVVRFTDAFPRTPAGRHIGMQLLRSGTSVAANYEEACAAESRADFIHKLTISLKELRESRFWLRLTVQSQLMQGKDDERLLREAEELCNIIAKSIITAKENLRSKGAART